MRYKSRISACNTIRKISKRNDVFMAYVIERINFARQSKTGNAEVPASRVAYIVDQLKRPEEAETLRSIYGNQFILVSFHLPIDTRQERLASRIAGRHADEPRRDQWNSVADELIKQDEKEADKRYGQRVSDVFPQADLIVDASNEQSMANGLNRFFRALFGDFAISPTKEEFFQNIASNVALTSCDLSRQCGAVIVKDGNAIATGFNEAPKALGGTYLAEEGYDARDVTLGRDTNTVRKRQMVVEIVQKLRNSKCLKDNTMSDDDIEAKFLDSADAPLKNTQIMDTLDYGRAVHAEMAALSTASRIGASVADGSMFCTTFPCHNCSKHIVASGLKLVSYVEPYSKSYARELYPDSIQIDQSTWDQDKVHFRQFTGITPVRFQTVFSKSGLKNIDGSAKKWIPKRSQPKLGLLDQAHISREVAFQKALGNGMSKKTRRKLGIVK